LASVVYFAALSSACRNSAQEALFEAHLLEAVIGVVERQ
jgi:hypothetical protein